MPRITPRGTATGRRWAEGSDTWEGVLKPYLTKNSLFFNKAQKQAFIRPNAAFQEYAIAVMERNSIEL